MSIFVLSASNSFLFPTPFLLRHLPNHCWVTIKNHELIQPHLTPPHLFFYPRLKAPQCLCGLITCIEHQIMAAAGSWLCVRCNNSQTSHCHKSEKAQWGWQRVSVSQAQFKYSSECKKILTEWRRGDKHTLKSSTLIHCIRRQNNSPAAISQRSHSRPRHLFFCQCKLTCHHLTILIKPQVQSGGSPPLPRWTPYLTLFFFFKHFKASPFRQWCDPPCLFGVQCG